MSVVRFLKDFDGPEILMMAAGVLSVVAVLFFVL